MTVILAARQWTDRLGQMVALSSGFGALVGLSGALVSATAPGLSTGPTIVLAAGVIVLISILFSPSRGLVANLFRHLRQSRQIQIETVLLALYELGATHADPQPRTRRTRYGPPSQTRPTCLTP
jgi:manganese/zinc/iron transport system permease protein